MSSRKHKHGGRSLTIANSFESHLRFDTKKGKLKKGTFPET